MDLPGSIDDWPAHCPLLALLVDGKAQIILVAKEEQIL